MIDGDASSRTQGQKVQCSLLETQNGECAYIYTHHHCSSLQLRGVTALGYPMPLQFDPHS